jgi:hypothetical protein
MDPQPIPYTPGIAAAFSEKANALTLQRLSLVRRGDFESTDAQIWRPFIEGFCWVAPAFADARKATSGAVDLSVWFN